MCVDCLHPFLLAKGRMRTCPKKGFCAWGTWAPLARKLQEGAVWQVSPLVHLYPFLRTATRDSWGLFTERILSAGEGEYPPAKQHLVSHWESPPEHWGLPMTRPDWVWCTVHWEKLGQSHSVPLQPGRSPQWAPCHEGGEFFRASKDLQWKHSVDWCGLYPWSFLGRDTPSFLEIKYIFLECQSHPTCNLLIHQIFWVAPGTVLGMEAQRWIRQIKISALLELRRMF